LGGVQSRGGKPARARSPFEAGLRRLLRVLRTLKNVGTSTSNPFRFFFFYRVAVVQHLLNILAGSQNIGHIARNAPTTICNAFLCVLVFDIVTN